MRLFRSSNRRTASNFRTSTRLRGVALEDRRVLETFLVSNLADAGAGSLRAVANSSACPMTQLSLAPQSPGQCPHAWTTRDHRRTDNRGKGTQLPAIDAKDNSTLILETASGALRCVG